MLTFANFKFRGTLFSKIRPNFCRPHAMSVFKILKNPFLDIHFCYNIKLILSPELETPQFLKF